MNEEQSCYQWQLVIAIVNPGHASRVIRIGKSAGIKGGTIILGHGTNRRPLLQFLELADYRRELVLMVAENPHIVGKTLNKLNEELKLERSNHGIAFSLQVSHFLGTGHYQYCDKNESEEHTMTNQAIFIIVDKGKAAEAMKIATEAGAQGGTIINARGSGIHETMTLFQMSIEPEKEILLIVSDIDKTESIVESVKTALEIEKPGNGIIFVQDVKQAVGLRKTK